MKISLKVNDPDGIMRALQESPEKLNRAMQTLVDKTTIFLRSRIMSKLHGQVLTKRSGRLFGGWTRKPAWKTPKGFAGIVGTNVKYARIHEYGGTIKRGPIKPRLKKALKFEIGGKVFIRRGVGPAIIKMPERPYVRPSIKETIIYLDREGPDTIMNAIMGAA